MIAPESTREVKMSLLAVSVLAILVVLGTVSTQRGSARTQTHAFVEESNAVQSCVDRLLQASHVNDGSVSSVISSYIFAPDAEICYFDSDGLLHAEKISALRNGERHAAISSWARASRDQHKLAVMGDKLVYMFLDKSVVVADIPSCKVEHVYAGKLDGSVNDMAQEIVLQSGVDGHEHRGTRGCEKERRRRNYLDLATYEKENWVKGYRELRKNGKLSTFRLEHNEASFKGFDGLTFHGNSGFSPWHRYFIWELEEQIRKLGGVYSCVTMPYWDWTAQAGGPVSAAPMWEANILGSNGNPPGGCVKDGLLAEGQYVDSFGGCLRRDFVDTADLLLPTAQMMQFIECRQHYNVYNQDVEAYHGAAHYSVGNLTAQMGVVANATDDVVFFMVHTFVDFLWALRADCHDYTPDMLPNPEIFETSKLHDVMSYPDLQQASWALVNKTNFTAKDMLTTKYWGYTYDAGDIIQRSGMTMATCNWDTVTHRAVEDWSFEKSPMSKVQHQVSLELHNMQVAEDHHHHGHGHGHEGHGHGHGHEGHGREHDSREGHGGGGRGGGHHSSGGSGSGHHKVHDGSKDAAHAKFACERMQVLDVKDGLTAGTCNYNAPLETCGPGPNPLVISLEEILNKTGVKGVKCIEVARTQKYPIQKQLGNLRSLCNGALDPVCRSQPVCPQRPPPAMDWTMTMG